MSWDEGQIALGRARRLLKRPGSWIEPVPGGYGLRAGRDRRARVLMTLDEAAFRRLVDNPGLKARPGGGWTRRVEASARPEPPRPGRPGVIEGERSVIQADGRIEHRRANLGHSAVAWLAGRRDAEGRPWLNPAQVAAAARLAMEAETALAGPSLTMRWDALPRAGGGSAVRAEPTDRMLAAASRVEAALAACGPARGIVEQICIHASALQAAERDLGLRRRGGRVLLQSGLRALAAHYRIG
jgi:hypothetical protein